MRIVLRIPEAFRGHYERDKFEDSLKRILEDVKSNGYLSGNYEIETLEMLMKAFEDSWEIRYKYLSDGIDNAIQLREIEKLTKAIRNEGKLKMGAIYGKAALEAGKEDNDNNRI